MLRIQFSKFSGRRLVQRSCFRSLSSATTASASAPTKLQNRDAQELDVLFKKLYPMVLNYVNLDGKEPVDGKRTPVVNFVSPDQLRSIMSISCPEKGNKDPEYIAKIVQNTLQYSVRSLSPRFWDKLYVGTDAIGQMGDFLTSVLNANMHTFACAPAFILMELELIKRMSEIIGFNPSTSDGVFGPGGSFVNLLSMIAARQQKFPHVKKHGYKQTDKPVCFTSQQAHYSIKIGAMTLGLGTDAVVTIPCDQNGKMIPEEFEKRVKAAKEKGQTPFYLNATAGTTVLGSYDPIDSLADVCARHGVFMNVDGCWGGSALMSAKHKHKMKGVERADSMTWNPHKMMGLPLQTSAFITRHRGLLQESASLSADYLFHDHPAKAYDVGEKSIQCGRHADALKFYLSWHWHGRQGYEAMVDKYFDNAQYFANLIKNDDRFQLVRDPEGVNVCYFYLPPSIRKKHARVKDSSSLQIDKPVYPVLDKATQTIYARMQQAGTMLVNFNPLSDYGLPRFFRIILSNPRTTHADMQFVLKETDRLGQDL